MSLHSIGAALPTPLSIPTSALQKKEDAGSNPTAFDPDQQNQAQPSAVQYGSSGSSSEEEALSNPAPETPAVTVQQSLDTESLVGVTTYDAQGKLLSQPPSAGQAVSFSA